MPAYPNIIPDWLQPENASVLDSPIIRGLRAVGRLIGADEPQGQVMGIAGPLGMVAEAPAVRRLPQILENLFAANPAAREAYERAQTAQLTEMAPEVLGGLPARQAEALGGATRTNMALQGLMAGPENVIPRPIPSPTGFETAIPLEAQAPVMVPPSRVMLGPTGRLRRAASNFTAPGFESKFSGY